MSRAVDNSIRKDKLHAIEHYVLTNEPPPWPPDEPLLDEPLEPDMREVEALPIELTRLCFN